MQAVRESDPTPEEKIAAIEEELNETYLEREEHVRGLLCALLASENALLLGPPGAAKSALVRDLCERISEGGRYFRTLLTRFSTPEQLLGHWSVRALHKQDRFVRKTAGYIAESDVAFIDEIYNANSAVLHELHPILNEREFFTDGAFRPIPLKMLVGASNRWPSERDGLDALSDRFMLRFIVSYISDKAFNDLVVRHAAGSGKPSAPPRKTHLREAELATLRDRVERLDVTAAAGPLVEIQRRLAEANISLSQRRYIKCLRVVAAQAVMSGRARAEVEDLTILAHVLWGEPSQIKQVRKIVMEVASPQLGLSLDLMDDAQEVYEKALSVPEKEKTNAGTDANSSLKRIQNRLLELRTDAANSGRSTERIDGFLCSVREMNREVVAKCLGLDT